MDILITSEISIGDKTVKQKQYLGNKYVITGINNQWVIYLKDISDVFIFHLNEKRLEKQDSSFHIAQAKSLFNALGHLRIIELLGNKEIAGLDCCGFKKRNDPATGFDFQLALYTTIIEELPDTCYLDYCNMSGSISTLIHDTHPNEIIAAFDIILVTPVGEVSTQSFQIKSIEYNIQAPFNEDQLAILDSFRLQLKEA